MKIKINGSYYNFFNKVNINFNLDSVASTFSFLGRFDSSNELHRNIFKPLSYHDVEIYTNLNELILKGTIVTNSLASSSQRTLQKLSGYGKSGIIEDCTIPYSLYPLEKNNVSLQDICNSLLPEFGVSFVVDDSAKNDMSLVYKKTVADPSETIKSFISKLAAQRNIIISNNEKGEIFFYKPSIVNTSNVRYFFNSENTLSMSLEVNGQSLHSRVTVIRQPSKDNVSLSPVDTVRNSMVSTNRSVVRVLSSGESTDTKKAANNLLATELKAISFKIKMNKIIPLRCGDCIEVLNPEIHIYKRAKLIVSSISIMQDEKSETMDINLVIPETFNGENPINIFE